jgi:carbonic anhydrase/acetyltransferase-like protein (isoleucine patch superfamily)
MFAVVFRSRTSPGTAMLPVAGRPLLARQLQWLRSAGCQRVVIGVAPGAEAAAAARWLDGDPLGFGVTLVTSARADDPRAIAQEAGLSTGAPMVALPSDVMGGGDLGALIARGEGGVARPAAPSAIADQVDAGEVHVLWNGAQATADIDAGGWTVRVRSLVDAMIVGAAALAGTLPPLVKDGASVPIHAAELRPGIWVARGAKIEPGADLVAPVLVGADALVRSGARVGPAVFLGERAVIESGVALSAALVARDTIVGEGLQITNASLDAEGIVDLASGTRTRVNDRLLLARRPDRRRLSFAPSTALTLTLTVALVWSMVAGAASARAPEPGGAWPAAAAVAP